MVYYGLCSVINLHPPLDKVYINTATTLARKLESSHMEVCLDIINVVAGCDRSHLSRWKTIA